MTDVRLTETANGQLRALRGDRRKAALRVLNEVEHRGCRAAGYRLTGDTLDHICCRHLYGSDRVLTMWEDEDHAVVVLIGRHDRTTTDVYGTLIDALGMEFPESGRSKPSCCGDDGLPPVDEQLVEAVTEAVRELGKR